MSGPPPKPTALKVLEGNPGKQKLNRLEPQPKRGCACPAHLSKEAKAAWRYYYDELTRCGILTKVDRAAFAAFCEAWGRWVRANKKWAQTGYAELATTVNGNIVQSPLVSIVNKAEEKLIKAAAELGMTPAARSRVIRAPGGDDDEPQGIRRFFKRVPT